MVRKKSRRLPPEGKRIEKPEDVSWKKWFESLDEEEHKKNLKMLGLDEAEFEEWEQMHGCLDEIIGAEEDVAEKKEKSKKKGK